MRTIPATRTLAIGGYWNSVSAVSVSAWIHIALVLAILPFALFGWSLHSILPGHDHTSCGHSHLAEAVHTHHHSHGDHSHSHVHHHGHHDEMPGTDLQHNVADTCQAEETSADQTSITERHDCQLCKVLTQLNTAYSCQPALATGEIQIPLCWIHYQNSFLASLDAYFLRGPPII